MKKNNWYVFWVFDVNTVVKSLGGRIISPDPMAGVEGPFSKEDAMRLAKGYSLDGRIREIEIFQINERLPLRTIFYDKKEDDITKYNTKIKGNEVELEEVIE